MDKDDIDDMNFEEAQALYEKDKASREKAKRGEKYDRERDRDHHGKDNYNNKKSYHRENDRERNRERERDRGRNGEKDLDREKERDKNIRHKDRNDYDSQRRHDKTHHSHHHDHDHDRDRDKDKDRNRDRDRNKDREREKYHSHSHHYSRSRSNSNHNRKEKQKEKLQVEKTIEEARRQALEAKRDDCTILMYRMSQKVKERDIFNFFCNANIGRIIDIKLIRDSRTGKSKCCSYVEFENKDCVLLAVSLNATDLLGQPVYIVSSQAEKNRLAAAAKYKKDQMKEMQRINLASASEQIDLDDMPMKIYVGGLTENLADVSEVDLQNIFHFGDIDTIELHRDPITGKCKGYAFIQFHKASQARQAIIAMNGFNYKGKQLKVGEANENNSYMMHNENIESRNEMMLKLSRTQQQHNDLNATTPGGFGGNSDTNCIVISNMFDMCDPRFESDEFFYKDLYEDVLGQCNSFGTVDVLWVDQGSQGNIWVRFEKSDLQSAMRTYEGLQGKMYDGRLINVKLIAESLFQATVPNK